MALLRAESAAWKVAVSPVVDSASPEVDWEMITPLATGLLAVLSVMALSSVESLMRMVLRPSMPAICEPVAVPVTSVTCTSPPPSARERLRAETIVGVGAARVAIGYKKKCVDRSRWGWVAPGARVVDVECGHNKYYVAT